MRDSTPSYAEPTMASLSHKQTSSTSSKTSRIRSVNRVPEAEYKHGCMTCKLKRERREAANRNIGTSTRPRTASEPLKRSSSLSRIPRASKVKERLTMSDDEIDRFTDCSHDTLGMQSDIFDYRTNDFASYDLVEIDQISLQSLDDDHMYFDQVMFQPAAFSDTAKIQRLSESDFDWMSNANDEEPVKEPLSFVKSQILKFSQMELKRETKTTEIYSDRLVVSETVETVSVVSEERFVHSDDELDAEAGEYLSDLYNQVENYSPFTQNSCETDSVPTLLVEDEHLALIEDQESLLLEDKEHPLLLKDKEPPLMIEDGEPLLLLEDQEQPLLLEDEVHPLLLENREPLLLEDRERLLLEDQAQPLMIENKKMLLLEAPQEPLLLEDQKETLLIEDREPLLLEPTKEPLLLADQGQPQLLDSALQVAVQSMSVATSPVLAKLDYSETELIEIVKPLEELYTESCSQTEVPWSEPDLITVNQLQLLESPHDLQQQLALATASDHILQEIKERSNTVVSVDACTLVDESDLYDEEISVFQRFRKVTWTETLLKPAHSDVATSTSEPEEFICSSIAFPVTQIAAENSHPFPLRRKPKFSHLIASQVRQNRQESLPAQPLILKSGDWFNVKHLNQPTELIQLAKYKYFQLESLFLIVESGCNEYLDNFSVASTDFSDICRYILSVLNFSKASYSEIETRLVGYKRLPLGIQSVSAAFELFLVISSSPFNKV